MTATNPHPLANPLNQSRFRNCAYGQNMQENHTLYINPKDLTVPDAKPYDPNAQSRLTVPNSDIPYYDGAIQVFPGSGFIGKSTLFKLADGSVIDMKSCKIVFDPNKKWKAKGYWNEPYAKIERKSAIGDWGKTPSIDSIIDNIDNGKPIDDPNLSPESIRYWKMAREESKKLEQNLTDEQKQLLDDLNSGKLFPLSKLVEEQ